jgi:hypothetical protein
VPVLPTLFFWASRLRGARVFHPRGVAFRARWEPTADSLIPPGTALDRSLPAIVRISHGVGFPTSFPDFIGVAIKLLDAHGPGRDQDLLINSTGPGPIGRHLFRPSRNLAGIPLSSILPYEIAGRRGPVYGRALQGSSGTTYADAVRAGEVPTFELRLRNRRGPTIARVEVDEPLPARIAEDIRFDPWHTGEPFRPIGWLNAVRRPTYRASQAGRRAREEGVRGRDTGARS